MSEALQPIDPGDQPATQDTQESHEMRVAALATYYEQLAPGQAMAVLRTTMWGDHIGALVALPNRNPEFARAVYSEFTESSNPDDRREIVVFLGHLTRADHDGGLALWDHLVRDPDEDVRRTAHDELSERIGQQTLGPAELAEQEALLTQIGLTWRDVAYLSRAYVEADQYPHARYQPRGFME